MVPTRSVKNFIKGKYLRNWERECNLFCMQHILLHIAVKFHQDILYGNRLMVWIKSVKTLIQEGPDGSNSLTWVSLSLVYSKRLWFLFIGLCMFKICWKWMFSDDRLGGAGQKQDHLVPYCWIGMWTIWSYVTKYQRPGPSGFRQKNF